MHQLNSLWLFLPLFVLLGHDFPTGIQPEGKTLPDRNFFNLDRGEWDAPTECHDSCPLCDEMTSCDWASCSDDIGFMDFVINHVADYWCIDMHQMHLTGGLCHF